jgi:uncharacterized protein YndB with AHSA1/START domain
VRVPTPPYVIEYEGSFTLPASPERVWSAIARFDRYEEWWSWLRELRVDGDGLQAGSILDGTVVPPLPYRMRIHVTLVECTAPRVIRATVEGDLRGQARLRLTPIGGRTRADVDWTIEMMQVPIRLVSRFARPVLLWGHDRVVDATVASFSRHLGRDM